MINQARLLGDLHPWIPASTEQHPWEIWPRLPQWHEQGQVAVQLRGRHS